MTQSIVLIGSTGLGAGDEELGGLLLANFLRILGDRPEKPEHIVLWNAGVKIAVEGSIWIEHLKKLEAAGVRIISCRTCIEYFGLEGTITIGEIGNMAQIQELLLTNPVLTV